MRHKGDPVTEKLDKIAGAVAGAIGLTRLQRRFDSGRTVRFRFAPLVLLVFAVVGLWVQIARAEGLGFLIVMFTWLASGAIQSFSPMGNLRGGQLDERETALVRSGHSAGFFAAMVVAVLGCIAFGLGGIAEMARLGSFWRPESGTDWFALAFLLLAVDANVATLAARAKQPEYLDDEEEQGARCPP
jgi:hypothetical protein